MQRLKSGLNKTRQALFGDIRLITADAGIEATDEIIQHLRKNCRNPQELLAELQKTLTEKLMPHERPFTLENLGKPAVILVIGVNGAGKTTTIGKLAHRFQQAGHKVIMNELAKIKRVLGKQEENAPHETLLVLDAGTGQNAVSQATQFHDAIGVTGLALTKLDGTAKGGVLFALARQFDIPVRFIGVGEQLDDLREFKAREFVSALLDTDTADDA